jgi:hypothetical protein
MLRSQDLVLLDWLRLFHTECLSVAEQDMVSRRYACVRQAEFTLPVSFISNSKG